MNHGIGLIHGFEYIDIVASPEIPQHRRCVPLESAKLRPFHR